MGYCVQEATVTAADLANQKELLAQLQSSVTNEFNLACVKMGTQNTASSASVCEVLDHIESITVVQVRFPAKQLHGSSVPYQQLS